MSSAAPSSPPRKAVQIVGAVLLFASFIGIAFGLQATSVGEEGLRNHGILGAGFLCFGASILLFVSMFAVDAWAKRPRSKSRYASVRQTSKTHPHTYGALGSFALIAVMAAVVALCAFLGTSILSEYFSDRASGPRTAVCTFSDAEKKRPHGRHRLITPTRFEIEFTSLEDDGVHRVSVSVNDQAALQEIADAKGVCTLSYYPASRIFVSAKPYLRTIESP